MVRLPVPAARAQGRQEPLPSPRADGVESSALSLTLDVELCFCRSWVGEQLRPVALSTPSRSHLENCHCQVPSWIGRRYF